MTQKRLPKNKRKIYDFTSQEDASNSEKYSKTLGVLFKITLLAYAQQCWKSDPKTPHFGELFGAKIDPRMRKSGSYIGTKIITIFIKIFLGFLLHFGAHGAPKKLHFFIKFWSWCRFWGILAPGECPKRSKTVSEADFSRIWYHFGAIVLCIFLLILLCL